MPQLLNRELELLDQQGPRMGLGFCGQPGRSLGEQHRLQRSLHHQEENHRRPSRPENHKTRSLSELLVAGDSNHSDQPAACGRQVCCGIRQSMPSSR
ncbi:hypothetical protein [Bradyrhizobium sp. 168]|uniref:hypothetical protein n=1 Tax=Bradyrhizobium sp. 168 TaxID=2782639 RepID=UPI001FF70D56|nr:hypothetical protein [Bradyrhizobium sp. 168]